MAVLTLNAGSSSLKFALFDAGQAILRGEFENITGCPSAKVNAADGAKVPPPKTRGSGHEAVLPTLFDWIVHHLDGRTLDAVEHRVVHGGDRFTAPILLCDAIIAEIEANAPLAPLHQPHNVAAMRICRQAHPNLPQAACFDTAFHVTMPAVARRLAIPASLGLRRYGFHGLSYEWIAGQLPPHLGSGRTIVAHLGSGASLCALAAGRSIETTMSVTPLDGLMMGTRCGSLDPGAVLYLLRQGDRSVDDVEHLLYWQSGLQGVSGADADLRNLREIDPQEAAGAIELFAYRIAQHAGATASALGGVDGFVFTGGIGEHDAALRADVCARLTWLGLTLDPAATAPGRISVANAAVEVWVIPTDEEAVIARQTVQLLQRPPL